MGHLLMLPRRQSKLPNHFYVPSSTRIMQKSFASCLLTAYNLASVILTTANACMQGSPTTGPVTPPPQLPLCTTTPPPSPPRDDCFGRSVRHYEYNGNLFNQRGGGPIRSGDELTCDFSQACCWQNEQAPADKLEWNLYSDSNAIDTAKFSSSKCFGTSRTPSGEFLVLPVEGRAPASDAGQFYSCSIACACATTVSLRHWQTTGVKLQVCQKDSFDSTIAPYNCKTISGGKNGDTATVTLPAKEFFDVAVVASKYVERNGGAAVIDDLHVKFTPCPSGGISNCNRTTTSSTTTTRPPPPTCFLACDFEKGTLCDYKSAVQSIGNGAIFAPEHRVENIPQFPDNPYAPRTFVAAAAPPGPPVPANDQDFQSPNWHVRQAPLGNRDTGVPGPAQGTQYAGVHYYAGQASYLEYGKSISLPKDRLLKFQYYEATEGFKLKVCKNSLSNCETVSNTGISVADRQWHQGQVDLPKDTTKVFFLGENDDGNVGAIGLDDVRLFETAADGGRQLCPPLSARKRSDDGHARSTTTSSNDVV